MDISTVIGTGPIVLLFMPLAFSSVCTTECSTIRDHWQRWQTLGAKVFGITVDSPIVTDKFRELERLPFLVLSDFNKSVIEMFGVVHDELIGLRGVAKRSVFVVDRAGVVTYAWVSDNPGTQVDFAAIESAVAEAR